VVTDERCGLLCLDVPGGEAIRAELEPAAPRRRRRAGLVRSRRDGKIVFYALTAIGRALVDAHLATEATV
jgi:hypothetical protein